MKTSRMLVRYKLPRALHLQGHLAVSTQKPYTVSICITLQLNRSKSCTHFPLAVRRSLSFMSMQSRLSTMDSPWYGVGARELSNVRVSGGFAAILRTGLQLLQVLLWLAVTGARFSCACCFLSR